ncbi:MAG TPA: MauE/DoxX family redox-associated membrane protein, partial [Gemmataceae bacterium]|nr:MauE/DoxX family redox-associated membrane protein [Gemmataceae bacterium]
MTSERPQPESRAGLPGGPPWNVVWSYADLRFALGTAFLFHGVTRFVSGWPVFADQMVQGFHSTFLPDFLVRPFALSVPPVEAILGTLLCLSLFTRWTLIAGGLWMIALVFGTTVRQDYPTVAIQLLYALLFFVLQVWEPANRVQPAWGRASQLAHAAVDVEFDAGNIGRLLGGEEGHCVSDLLGLAYTLHGNLGNKASHHILRRLGRHPHFTEDWRLNRPRGDGVGTNSSGQQFRRQRPGQRPQRRFAGRVNAGRREALDACHRRSEDYRPAVFKQRQRLLYGEVCSLEVGVHHLIENRLRRLLDGGELGKASID